MRKPIYIRPLTEDEQHTLQEGLRSSNAFVLRRCQILLASARGQTARVIGEALGCDDQTVRNVFMPSIPKAWPPWRAAPLPRGGPPMRPSMRRAASSYVPSCTRVHARLPSHQPVDVGARGHDGVCRGPDAPAHQWRSYSPGAGMPRRPMEAGQTLDHQSRSRVHPKKNGATG